MKIIWIRVQRLLLPQFRQCKDKKILASDDDQNVPNYSFSFLPMTHEVRVDHCTFGESKQTLYRDSLLEFLKCITEEEEMPSN